MTTYEAIAALIRTALFQAPLDLPEDLDWEPVFQEIQNQSICVLMMDLLPKLALPEDIKQKWTMFAYKQTRHYYVLLDVERELTELLRANGIGFVILKGTAVAVYYPKPGCRTMGDIDFIVRPEQFEEARSILQNGGFEASGKNDARHVTFDRRHVHVELHRRFTSVSKQKKYDALDDAVMDGISHCCWTELEKTTFPMLPEPTNGLVLLEHIRHHLVSGLGLRQILDWIVYVDRQVDDASWYSAFQEPARALDLETLAKVVARMGQLYFGLREDITWCADAEEELCSSLLQLLIKSGNFGKNDIQSSKTETVLQHSQTVPQLFRNLQKAGCHNWKALKKHKWLRPFAWFYQIFRYGRQGFSRKAPLKALRRDLSSSRYRAEVLQKLGVTPAANGVAKSEIQRQYDYDSKK